MRRRGHGRRARGPGPLLRARREALQPELRHGPPQELLRSPDVRRRAPLGAADASEPLRPVVAAPACGPGRGVRREPRGAPAAQLRSLRPGVDGQAGRQPGQADALRGARGGDRDPVEALPALQLRGPVPRGRALGFAAGARQRSVAATGRCVLPGPLAAQGAARLRLCPAVPLRRGATGGGAQGRSAGDAWRARCGGLRSLALDSLVPRRCTLEGRLSLEGPAADASDRHWHFRALGCSRRQPRFCWPERGGPVHAGLRRTGGGDAGG
mmetsp:Transcript_40630/g.126664  ORF Transcript_40630/g.126664 Transcript_40630/m.126664 type:complete len:269 (+) Transcript_40630:874-1680(+)